MLKIALASLLLNIVHNAYNVRLIYNSSVNVLDVLVLNCDKSEDGTGDVCEEGIGYPKIICNMDIHGGDKKKNDENKKNILEYFTIQHKGDKKTRRAVKKNIIIQYEDFCSDLYKGQPTIRGHFYFNYEKENDKDNLENCAETCTEEFQPSATWDWGQKIAPYKPGHRKSKHIDNITADCSTNKETLNVIIKEVEIVTTEPAENPLNNEIPSSNEKTETKRMTGDGKSGFASV